jgi:tRNA(fMet)-specific endonuclease VapC
MQYLLDTNICIYLIKKKPIEVLRQFSSHSIGELGLSSITVSELKYGVEKSQQKEKNERALEKFLIPFVIEPFDYRAAVIYGKIRAYLEADGNSIGPLDNLIAAHALSLDLTLVTNNTKEFLRVPGLKVVNWVNK